MYDNTLKKTSHHRDNVTVPHGHPNLRSQLHCCHAQEGGPRSPQGHVVGALDKNKSDYPLALGLYIYREWFLFFLVFLFLKCNFFFLFLGFTFIIRIGQC